MSIQLEPLEQKVRAILIQHIGKNNQMDAGTIAKILGIEDNDTHVNTRKIITSVLRKTDLPIGSTSKGYYIIQSKDELMEYAESLNRRANEDIERRIRVIDNYSRYYGDNSVQGSSSEDTDEQ